MFEQIYEKSNVGNDFLTSNARRSQISERFSAHLTVRVLREGQAAGECVDPRDVEEDDEGHGAVAEVQRRNKQDLETEHDPGPGLSSLNHTATLSRLVLGCIKADFLYY